MNTRNCCIVIWFCIIFVYAIADVPITGCGIALESNTAYYFDQDIVITSAFYVKCLSSAFPTENITIDGRGKRMLCDTPCRCQVAIDSATKFAQVSNIVFEGILRPVSLKGWNSTITNNKVNYIGLSCPGIFGPTIIGLRYEGKYALIANNYIEGLTSGGTGIYVLWSSYVMIRDNVIINSIGSVVGISTDISTDAIAVVNNTITNITQGILPSDPCNGGDYGSLSFYPIGILMSATYNPNGLSYVLDNTVSNIYGTNSRYCNSTGISYTPSGFPAVGIQLSLPAIVKGNVITNIVSGSGVSSRIYSNAKGGNAWGINYVTSFPTIDVLNNPQTSYILCNKITNITAGSGGEPIPDHKLAGGGSAYGISMGNPGLYGWRGTFPVMAGNLVRQITSGNGKPPGMAVGLQVTADVNVINNDVAEVRAGNGFNDAAKDRFDPPPIGGSAVGINIASTYGNAKIVWNKIANIYAGNGGSLNATFTTLRAGGGGSAYGFLAPYDPSTVINSRVVYFVPNLRANTIINIQSGLVGVNAFNSTLYNGLAGTDLAVYPFRVSALACGNSANATLCYPPNTACCDSSCLDTCSPTIESSYIGCSPTINFNVTAQFTPLPPPPTSAVTTTTSSTSASGTITTGSTSSGASNTISTSMTSATSAKPSATSSPSSTSASSSPSPSTPSPQSSASSSSFSMGLLVIAAFAMLF